MSEIVEKSAHFRQMSLIVPKLDCEMHSRVSSGKAARREKRGRLFRLLPLATCVVIFVSRAFHSTD